MDSEQLHLYKYYFEKLNPNKKIRNLYFLFVPKTQLRIKYKNKTNKRDEKLNEFRNRLLTDMQNKEITIKQIDYDPNKVIGFITNGKHAVECDDYIKQPTRLCDWCEYQKFCEKGDDLEMVLPSTNRRTIEKNSYKKIWIYGLPFSGKTYLANEFETPLMLNTDGNFKQVDAPVVRIIDEVTQEGRITKRKYAWEVFQDTVTELEKGSEFKTIIVDLLEDVYDACRIKVCVDNGWDHESDDSFKAYDIVRSEFLRTLKRLINLDYNIVLISHEDTSRDITKKTGDKITAIKPNLQEKLALKVAGMVDLCFRIVNDNGNRTISFKSNEVEFGGGRLNIKAKEIPAKYEELMKVYNESNTGKKVASEQVSGQVSGQVETATAEPAAVETPEEPVKRTRKKREVVEEAKTVTNEAGTVIDTTTGEVVENVEKPVEKTGPVKRTRRKRTEDTR
jgi:phage nucleotide-binding protein